MSSRYLTILLLSLACLGVACAPSVQPPPKKIRIYDVAKRQLPPAPVYNRLREGRPAEPIPPTPITEGTPLIAKVYQLDMQDASLKEISKQLAASVSYSQYCASSIAGRRLSVKALGTIDELAAEISRKGNITAMVDHRHQEIRFLAKSVSPKLFQGSEQKVD